MEDQHKGAQRHPALAQAGHVPGVGLDDVVRPLDDELRDVGVGPEHGEAHQKVPQVLQALFGQELIVRGVDAGGQDHEDDDEGDRADRLADHEEHAVDPREPVGAQRHPPVEGCQRHRQHVDDDQRAADGPDLVGQVGAVAVVLALADAVVVEGDGAPDQQINGRADHEEGFVEPVGLDRYRRVPRQVGFVGPGVEVREAKDERDEEERHHRDDHRARLERPADGRAPRTPGELNHHQHDEAAEREADEEHERHQVGLEEALERPQHEPDERQHQAGGADDERHALEAIDVG